VLANAKTKKDQFVKMLKWYVGLPNGEIGTILSAKLWVA
jgi:hypothetical protein